LNRWGKRHAIGGLYHAELRRRLRGRRQGHSVRRVDISLAATSSKPVVDRNIDGKYD
jgi:hypothetical protein